MGPPLVLAIIGALALGYKHGVVGAIIGLVAGLLIYLAIGAVVWMGRDRGGRG
ncbi:MAG: hypothetical protein QOI18_782 [Solirubrobacteraceae bacterium]|jgi:hypothetical protein|nr:hypothetical protein [Solirubrobacteraceae bacterium]